MRTLKLLLTNKYYRWATLEKIKLKFLSLPIIKDYVEIKNRERDNEIKNFIITLIRLEACVTGDRGNEELFEQTKLDVLCSEVLYKLCLKDFKKWLESITSSEYVEIKNNKNKAEKFCFVAALTRLEACIMIEGEDEEFFELVKKDVSYCHELRKPCLKDFKKWLESINSSEKDYSRVQELINSYTSKTH